MFTGSPVAVRGNPYKFLRGGGVFSSRGGVRHCLVVEVVDIVYVELASIVSSPWNFFVGIHPSNTPTR